MLPKKFRLPIQNFPRQAKTVFRNKYFTVKTASNSLRYNRLGVVISKGSVKRPAQRNLLRRRVFDFFRLEEKFIGLGGETGKDLLLILNPAIMNLAKKELEEELKDHGEFI